MEKNVGAFRSLPAFAGQGQTFCWRTTALLLKEDQAFAKENVGFAERNLSFCQRDSELLLAKTMRLLSPQTCNFRLGHTQLMRYNGKHTNVLPGGCSFTECQWGLPKPSGKGLGCFVCTQRAKPFPIIRSPPPPRERSETGPKTPFCRSRGTKNM